MLSRITRYLFAAALLGSSVSCIHKNSVTVSPSYSQAKIRSLDSFHVRRHDHDAQVLHCNHVSVGCM